MRFVRPGSAMVGPSGGAAPDGQPTVNTWVRLSAPR
jgi:hypothetical protein